MFDPMEWLDECERRLAEADSLAERMTRTCEPAGRGEIDVLRLRIAALRAEFERARIAMGLPRLTGGGGAAEGQQAPWRTTERPRRISLR